MLLPTAMADMLPKAVDFQSDAQLAGKDGRVIVVILSQPDCHYCEWLKEHQLQHLSEDKNFGHKVLVRELHTEDLNVKDFSGQSIGPVEFAERYEAFFYPTVLFLGPNGKELTYQIIGVESYDYYSYYLEKSLREALAELS